MGKFSLLTVVERKDGLVSGNWIQDFTGSVDEAIECARATEKANSNRVEVAVVERTGGSVASFAYISNEKEITTE